MKLWDRIIKYRLRRVTNITENQFGFMPKRLTMKTIFLIRQLIKRYGEQKKDMYMVFIDLEKVYDEVPRNVMRWTLQMHKVSTMYITKISVWTNDRDTNDFSINLRLHQGSTLSPYLFALVMGEVTRDKVVSLDTCSLWLMWFWWMRVGQGLTRSWNCVDGFWRQNIFGLVGLKQNTWSVISTLPRRRGMLDSMFRCHLRKTPFAIWDRHSRRMGISMKMS
jgi:hypothetical protein